jgi:hypothetical protein
VIVHSAIHDCVYDKVHQVLRFTFRGDSKEENENDEEEDDADDGLPGLIPYSEISEKAIAFIEGLGKAVQQQSEAESGQSPDTAARWFICSRERRGLVPLSAFGEKGTEDFYFG